MKKVHLNNITLDIIDSWTTTNVNENYTIIHSKKIGESYCILSLYYINNYEGDFTKICNNSIQEYKANKKFKLINKIASGKKESYKWIEREIQYLDRKNKQVINVIEKIIDIDDELYVLSGVVPVCPLFNQYKSMLKSVFASLEFGIPAI